MQRPRWQMRWQRLSITGALALFTAALPPAGAAWADEGELTLEEAVRRGRSDARQVASSEARREVAEARLEVAKSYRRPSVRLMEAWTRTDSPAEVFALQLNQEAFSFADFVSGDPNRPEPLESATTRLEVSVPLYTGGELPTRVEQASLAVVAASGDLARSADASALAAGEAWVRLAQAREQVALLERSLATVEAHTKRVRALVDQGMAVESDRLRAEVERARVADLLAAARSGARVAEADLSFRLAAPLDSPWSLAELGPPPPEPPDLEILLAAAEDRPDLVAARRRLEIAELEQKVARAGRLPKARLVARHDRVGDVPFAGDGDNTAVMVEASLDLWSGGRHRAAMAAAGAGAEAASSEVASFAEGVRLAVMAAWSEARSARERHATARRALGAARENERILNARFGQGVAPLLDLLDATTARREAENRELLSRADTHVTGLRLYAAAGLGPERLFEGDLP